MTNHVFGQVCALLAAIAWAFAVVWFKRSGDKIAPLPLNLFKNVVALVLLAATLLVIGERFETLRRFSREDFWILLFSGVVGIALADTLFFHSLNLIGVGIVSIVDCLYSPFTILFAALLLFEELTTLHLVGGGLIISGVLISSGHEPPADRTRAQVTLGVLLGAVAVALMGFGIVLAKPVLDVAGFPLFWATTLRLLAGTAALALFAAASPGRREHFAVFRPSGAWKHAIPGSIAGAYLAMLLWVAGYKYTHATVAALLNQTAVIFALILATLMLNERFTRRKAASVALALSGIVLVTFNSQ